VQRALGSSLQHLDLREQLGSDWMSACSVDREVEPFGMMREFQVVVSAVALDYLVCGVAPIKI
jgi:hypothetical protein